MTHPSIFVKQAILFDLDGVLVDSTESVARTWRNWASQHGIDAEKLIPAAHGRRTIETVREFAPHLDAEAEAVKLEHTEAHDHEGLQVVPGARELIAQIPGERWAICTSGTTLLATARLRAVSLPIPRVLVSAEAVGNGKPHPEPYLRSAERLGYRAADCLVFEDSPAGILSGKHAGASVIGVATTYPISELKDADAIVADLRPITVTGDGAGLRIEIAKS